MTEGPDRLSDDDARILALESTTLTGHTLKLLILSPGPPVDIHALRQSVLARLPSQPRARERIEFVAAGHATAHGAGDAAAAGDRFTQTDEPQWVPAENFDIANHVRRHA